MATFSQIKSVRLRIADPGGMIDIQSVSDLPGTPVQQTAYYYHSEYYVNNGAAYQLAKLRISDSYLTTLIDTYGVDLAVCRSYALIMAQLGNELILVRNQSGAESAEYLALKDAMAYYRQLKADCDEQNNKDNSNSTGRFYRSRQPRIAGGNL